jgi:hypothetical protein
MSLVATSLPVRGYDRAQAPGQDRVAPRLACAAPSNTVTAKRSTGLRRDGSYRT